MSFFRGAGRGGKPPRDLLGDALVGSMALMLACLAAALLT